MNTSRTNSFRKALRFVAVPLALTAMAGAFAAESADSGPASESVAALKSSLPSSMGFEVDDVRMTNDGVACITYRVANDNGGESRSQAVVDGDKVLRSTIGNTRFQKAWNSKCVGASSGD